MQISWEPAFSVACPLMITLRDADARIVECLFWSVIVVR